MKLSHKVKLLLPLLIFGVFYILAFAFLEKIDRPYFFTPSIDIDHKIPFIPIFVIPYIMWFIWVPFVCGLLLIADEECFIRTRRLLIIGMTVFLAFSAVIPTRLFLRPEVVEDQGVCGDLLRTLYRADTSTNVFPSIPVYNSCVVWHAVMTSDEWLFSRKWFRVFTSVQAILIILSTMFIKQHSIIDVIGAFLMFAVVLFLDKVLIENNKHTLKTGDEK